MSMDARMLAPGLRVHADDRVVRTWPRRRPKWAHIAWDDQPGMVALHYVLVRGPGWPWLDDGLGACWTMEDGRLVPETWDVPPCAGEGGR